MWDHISTGQSGTSLQNIEVSFQCSGTQKQCYHTKYPTLWIANKQNKTTQANKQTNKQNNIH
jgi:hypothetical protein